MAFLQCVIVAVLNGLLQISSIECHKLESRFKRQADAATNSSTMPLTTPMSNTTVVEYENSETSRVGLVVGVICGIVALIAAMAIIATIWIRNKRSRDAEYERAAKVQLSSTRSAGVYNDLTTSPIVKTTLDRESTEMDKLKNEDEEV